MSLHQVKVKKHRHIAIETNEIIALDFNESLNDLKIYLRGGGTISVEGKKSSKIWKQLSKDLKEWISDELDEFLNEDVS